MTHAEIRVIHVTDPHITPAADEPFAGIDSFATLERVLTAVKRDAWGCDLVVATGDLSNDGSPSSYRRVRDAFLELDVPVWCVPGNHDLLPEMAAHLAGGPVHVMERAVLGAWQIVPLASQVPGAGHGHLDDDALGELDAALHAEPARHALIAMHHGPASECPDPGCRLDNAAALLAVLGRHTNVRGVLAGHTHVAADDVRAGVRVLVAPATSLQLTHPRGPLAEGATFWESHHADPRVGYRRVELGHDGAVESAVVWVEG